MAGIAWDDVVNLAPDLSGVSYGAQDLILEYVNDALAVDQFGGEDALSLKMARIYLAAHMAVLERTAASGSPGQVVSESVGGLSRTYASSSSGAATGFAATSYGRAYLDIVHRSMGRVMVAL